MTPETLALIASYLMCSEAAEVRVLDSSEIEHCTSIYTEVKLGFVPEVSLDEYQIMSAAQRAEVNQRGYAGFLAWRSSNAGPVTELDVDAKSSEMAVQTNPPCR
ncbi:hypothetical protein [uncultured Roseobacter sp.]|uniref:hypothetical protein n=1 Tax=uncultured Roseobacter sp. TaxID=114847 RepID=UPI00260C7777|nr:hypothetical protein [uncultured Roseobacter sp.]